MFIETSSPRGKGDEALLATPTLTWTSPTSCFTFWYNMNGAAIATLELLTVAPDLRRNKHVLWTMSGSQGLLWQQAKITVNTTSPLRFFFRGVRGDSYTGDIAIDDVKATEGGCILADCDFENNTLCGWSNARDGSDQLDWTLHQGATSTHGTGPSTDHTLGNTHGHYIYIDTSPASIRPNDSAILTFSIAIRGVVGDKGSSDMAVDDIIFTKNLNCQLAPQTAILHGHTHVDLHPVVSAKSSTADRTTISTTHRTTTKPVTHVATQVGCDFENNTLCGWRNANYGSDQLDWTLHHGSASTNDTEAMTDHTLGNNQGHYLYLNTSNESVKPNDTALLVSEEKAPPTASVCLMFWYYVNGGNTSHLDVFLVDSASQTGRELWSTIVIRGVVGDESSFEMGVDDITFVEDFNCTLTPDEAGVNATVEIDLTIDEIPEVYPEAHFGQGTGPTVWLDDLMCIGSEVELDQCRHNGWGNTDCNRSESVGVICTHGNVNPTVLTEAFFGQGDGVVLMSDLSCQGSEVTVHECPRKQQSELQCTHQEDVGVICSECNSNPVVHHGGVYGPGSGPILLDEVRCLGVELDIARCSHDPWGLTDCTHAEDVGVACPAGIHEKYLFFGSATSVVEVHSGAHFGPGSGHVLFANLECVGTETDLQQCPHKAASPIYCPHDRDVGVTCGHVVGDVGDAVVGTGGGGVGVAECEHGSLCHWVNSNELGSPHPNTRLDWTVTGPASRFGPRVDHTKHNAQGHFARFRPKNNQQWTQAWLVSPSMSSPTLTGCLVFWFALAPENNLNVYSMHSNDLQHSLWKAPDRSTDAKAWEKGRVPITFTRTGSHVQSLKVALVAKQNTGRGYVLLDDVSFTSGSYDGHTASSTTQKVTSQAPSTRLTLMSTSTTRKPILPLHTSQSAGSPVDCNFDSGVCSYEQPRGDAFDWTRHSGRTPTTGTGPNTDHTTGHGYYMFIETSSPRINGDKALLATPTLNWNSPSSCFTFWYSMNGRTLGALELLTAAPDLHNIKQVWTKSGSQGSGWHQARISVDTTSPLKFLFRGTRSTSNYGDIAIDDVKASKGECSLDHTTAPLATTTAHHPHVASTPAPQTVDVRLFSSCDFENTCQSYIKGPGDFAWTTHSGPTSTGSTGPSVDHTRGTRSGHYAYTEATSHAGKTARMLTGEFPATQSDVCLKFYYHMYGRGMGTLNIKVTQRHSCAVPMKLTHCLHKCLSTTFTALDIHNNSKC
ncbi:hypothetical protein BaRGS_00019947 [Batillaria attramentaria]|uniref:MAM and LDL-receptor class A domain-containing protein 1-like n=1 Tax=Batillaria attramentaria TaxID=370345 RepID=A0ABD0KNV8_9CAEN